ncbi:MAG: hydrogenase iron-sulfur subunit [Deltaproteobacteria bacterium]|nr:hydrogenase iron-sulfur subunit [Deltaproteobacteria bacterium]
MPEPPKQKKLTLALFYCQHTPESGKQDRQSLEEKYGKSIRLFPIPCSGRLEPLHLLRALEEFADAAYVITCPEGECRYFEGNLRAKKMAQRTREIIESIGLEGERIGIVMNKPPKSLARQADEIMENTLQLSRSPVLSPHRAQQEKGERRDNC